MSTGIDDRLHRAAEAVHHSVAAAELRPAPGRPDPAGRWPGPWPSPVSWRAR
jgi:hypothetical protein